MRSMTVASAPVQSCGLVACQNENITSCGVIDYKATTAPRKPVFKKIIIEAHFANHKDSVVFPSTVTYDLDSLNYNSYTYSREDQQTSIVLRNGENQGNNIMTFGIYAHTYPNSAGSVISINIILLIISICMYCFKMN